LYPREDQLSPSFIDFIQKQIPSCFWHHGYNHQEDDMNLEVVIEVTPL